MNERDWPRPCSEAGEEPTATGKAIDGESMSVTDRLGDDAVFSFDRVFGPTSDQGQVFEVGGGAWCELKLV